MHCRTVHLVVSQSDVEVKRKIRPPKKMRIKRVVTETLKCHVVAVTYRTVSMNGSAVLIT